LHNIDPFQGCPDLDRHLVDHVIHSLAAYPFALVVDADPRFSGEREVIDQRPAFLAQRWQISPRTVPVSPSMRDLDIKGDILDDHLSRTLGGHWRTRRCRE
jgi:hypothetical protein